MDCAGIDGIIVVNLVGKNIACCEVDKRGDARDALMGECVGLVEIETEWNLKSFDIFQVDRPTLVEIETEWNLKA